MSSTPKANRTPAPDCSLIEPTEPLWTWVVSRIAPFFNDGIGGSDDALTQEAARQVLLCYEIVTGRELQLSAQVSAFGVASLDCLRCSMTERDLPIPVLLRIQGNALALNDMAEKSRRTLEARQRARRRGQVIKAEAMRLDEAEFETLVNKAREMVTFARTSLEAHQISKARGQQPASNRETTPPPAVTEAAKPAASRTAKPAAAKADPKAPPMRPLAAEQMTPSVLARRKNAGDLWAQDLLDLVKQQQGQTKH